MRGHPSTGNIKGGATLRACNAKGTLARGPAAGPGQYSITSGTCSQRPLFKRHGILYPFCIQPVFPRASDDHPPQGAMAAAGFTARILARASPLPAPPQPYRPAGPHARRPPSSRSSLPAPPPAGAIPPVPPAPRTPPAPRAHPFDRCGRMPRSCRQRGPRGRGRDNAADGHARWVAWRVARRAAGRTHGRTAGRAAGPSGGVVPAA